MARTKAILEVLTVPRLRELCDDLHVSRAGTRTRARLVAALRAVERRRRLRPVGFCRAKGRSEDPFDMGYVPYGWTDLEM